MSTKKPTYKETMLDVKPPFPYRDSLYNGTLMAIGIPIFAYVVERCLGKKYYINVNTNQIIALSGIVIISRFGIDFIKRERLIPLEM